MNDIERAQLIIEFYEEGEKPLMIRLVEKIIEMRRKYEYNSNDNNNDTSRNNNIYNNSTINTWDDEVAKIFNNEEIK